MWPPGHVGSHPGLQVKLERRALEMRVACRLGGQKYGNRY
jgi:hypothetical protein